MDCDSSFDEEDSLLSLERGERATHAHSQRRNVVIGEDLYLQRKSVSLVATASARQAWLETRRFPCTPRNPIYRKHQVGTPCLATGKHPFLCPALTRRTAHQEARTGSTSCPRPPRKWTGQAEFAAARTKDGTATVSTGAVPTPGRVRL